jgi:hypothetical protein
MDTEIFWLWPQRERLADYLEHEDEVWSAYRKSAERAGLTFTVIAADDVVVQTRPGSARVYVHGREVHPDTSMFHTSLLTWPCYQVDVWRFLSTFAVIEAAGFCTTIPTPLTLVNNDKLLTLMQPYGRELPWVPTTRILTRFYWSLHERLNPELIDFPVLVKPASWGSGFGVTKAESLKELNAILQLAGAAELPMVIQPWLGEGISDCRVYVVDGVALTANIRSPRDGSLVASVTHGGETVMAEVPPHLVEPAKHVAASLGLRYVCVDFLVRGDDYWLSEIEMDGSINADQTELRDAMFRAYRGLFDDHVAGHRAGRR